MADGERTGIGLVFLVALAAVVLVAFIGCGDGSEPAATGPSGAISSGDVVIKDDAQMAQMVGQDVAAQGVRVQHVAADEGFWVDLVGGRVWVQLSGIGESPYTVRDGDVVSFRGKVLAHDRTFPNGLGMCSQQDWDALAALPTHISVPYDSLSFGVG